VEAARKNLADARARQAGALSASVINRIDDVETGVHPLGPGRKAITLAGGIGGLLFGFGLVFLFGTPNPPRQPALSAAAPTHVLADPVAAGSGTSCTARKTNGNANGNSRAPAPASASATENLFRGMTLEQAVRSVEQLG
jgi:hypothetical protein